jgi:hypothetical protein
MGICHVSNKGAPDGNWNLQVSFKPGEAPGHVKHLDSTKFCPPDFRSVKAACTVANALVYANACR